MHYLLATNHCYLPLCTFKVGLGHLTGNGIPKRGKSVLDRESTGDTGFIGQLSTVSMTIAEGTWLPKAQPTHSHIITTSSWL